MQGSGTAARISSTLPSNPAQIAVDQLGDVFAVGGGTPSIQELKVAGPPASPGAPATFTGVSIPYTTLNAATPVPQAIAVDNSGNVYVADNQGAPAANAVYRLSLAPNSPETQTTVATGLSNPVSLAVDGDGQRLRRRQGCRNRLQNRAHGLWRVFDPDTLALRCHPGLP